MSGTLPEGEKARPELLVVCPKPKTRSRCYSIVCPNRETLRAARRAFVNEAEAAAELFGDRLLHARVWAAVLVTFSFAQNVEAGDILFEDEATRQKRLDRARFMTVAAAVVSRFRPMSLTPEQQLGVDSARARVNVVLEPILKAVDADSRALVERCAMNYEKLNAVADELGLPRTTAHRKLHRTLEIIGKALGGREQVKELIEQLKDGE